jgi:hypothetical protein
MSSITLGLHGVHALRLDTHPELIPRLARLVVDPRWSHQFKLITIGYVPHQPRTPAFRGQIPVSKLEDAVRDTLASASCEDVLFGVSRQDRLADAMFHIELGRGILLDGASPLTVRAMLRIRGDASDNVAAQQWLELQHEILEVIGASHGVIVAATDENVLRAELWLSNIHLDGRPVHPDPAEISSYAVQRSKLGDEYIRAPRWGTYLKPTHVAAVGGRDKIISVVKPPVVREVGELLYVQLSERVADALAPETEARRRVFADLLAPITMPRLEDTARPG